MVLDKTIVDNQVSPGIQQLFLQTALGTMTTAKGNGTLRPYLEAEYERLVNAATDGYQGFMAARRVEDRWQSPEATTQILEAGFLQRYAARVEALSFARLITHLADAEVAALNALIASTSVFYGAGTLSDAEFAEIQAIANKYNTQIDIVGSRANGMGRGVNDPELPVGKGAGTRSDVDFRCDTLHPQADAISAELNAVSNGAGNAAARHSNNPLDIYDRRRAAYPPVIIIKPK